MFTIKEIYNLEEGRYLYIDVFKEMADDICNGVSPHNALYKVVIPAEHMYDCIVVYSHERRETYFLTYATYGHTWVAFKDKHEYELYHLL